MLAKIFGILLGIIGVTTTIVNSPAPSEADRPQKPPPAIKMVEKTVTVKNAENEIADLNKLKSTVTVPRTKTVTASITPTATPKNQPKKPEEKTPKKNYSPIAARAATSSNVALTPPLNLQPKVEVTPPPDPVNFPKINEVARKAVVNIICTSKHGGSFEPLSGSGVIIDPRGIILTNAHVAQYLLLQNYRVKDFLTCIGRTGSPATPAYTLKLLYLSEKWLRENYKIITSSKPMGTGENDFALLRITGSTNPDLNRPETFPAIIPETNEDKIKTGQPVLIIGYPAGFLGGIAIQRELYIASSITNVGKLFTFRDGTLDVFGLGGSPVAQQGSSGGAVVNSDEGKLLGIIVTSTNANSTADRNLDALSIGHVNRSLSVETGFTLDSLLASDIDAFEKNFEEKILPSLKKLLVDELDSKNR